MTKRKCFYCGRLTWVPYGYPCEKCTKVKKEKSNLTKTFGILKPEVKAIYSVKGKPVAVDKHGNVVSHSHYDNDPHGWRYAGKQCKKTYITI